MRKKLLILLNVLVCIGLFTIMPGCDQNNASVNQDVAVFDDDAFMYDPPEELEGSFILLTDLSDGKQHSVATSASSTTYAYGLVQIYDQNEHDYDWLVIFYLPYNPGTAYFQGSALWGWQTYSGSWAQVYETRWTSRGFRIKILVGRRVTSVCGTSPSDYRIVY